MEESKIDTTSHVKEENYNGAIEVYDGRNGTQGSGQSEIYQPHHTFSNIKTKGQVKRTFDSEEERKLMDSVQAGKNRGISEIVKDNDLRKIWMSSFFKKTVLTKNSIKKIDIHRALARLNEIKDSLTIQNRSILLAGLGEVLKRKYNLSQDDVQNILKVILNPIKKDEEEDTKEEEETPKKKKRKTAKRDNAQKERPFNLFKLLDIQSLYIPLQPAALNYTSEKSSLSSKLFGQTMSGEDMAIQRDNELNDNLERSLEGFGSRDGSIMKEPKTEPENNFNFNQDSVGSISKEMLMNDPQNSVEDRFQMEDDPAMGAMEVFDNQIMQNLVNAGLNIDEDRIKKVKIADIELSDSNSTLEEGELIKRIKNINMLKESLVNDEDINSNNTLSCSSYFELGDPNGDGNLDRKLEKFFNKISKTPRFDTLLDEESCITPLSSTDDDSCNDQNYITKVIKQCKNLPLKIEKNLQIIKEESEGIDDFGGFDVDEELLGPDVMDSENILSSFGDLVEKPEQNFFKLEPLQEIETAMGDDLTKTLERIDKELHNKDSVSYSSLVQGNTKSNKCQRFLELLHLKKRNKINLMQNSSIRESEFGELVIMKPAK
ncbi:unnamed protein product [Moneuplotes crassus]|uniref:Rad21/Rec8-like protein N-terminal domain-containing protein n=1 Tax=Euplotes crassus TaxID=5936 RepID=A0AAD1TZM9_EUPCR|nr:unnamed protein product [Moneuplotes crassus]